MVLTHSKTRNIIGALLLCSALFLAACSQTSKPVNNQNIGELINLDLSFNNQDSSLSTLGIPFEGGAAVVTRFEVQVFDENDTLVTFDSENIIKLAIEGG